MSLTLGTRSGPDETNSDLGTEDYIVLMSNLFDCQEKIAPVKQ